MALNLSRQAGEHVKHRPGAVDFVPEAVPTRFHMAIYSTLIWPGILQSGGPLAALMMHPRRCSQGRPAADRRGKPMERDDRTLLVEVDQEHLIHRCDTDHQFDQLTVRLG